MNGLQVKQTTEYYPFSNIPTNTTTSQKQTVPVGYLTVGDPRIIYDDIFAPSALSPDYKVYFRQEKLSGMMHNQSAADVMVDLYYMTQRRNVVRAEFSSLNSLLSDNSIATNNWMTDVTSGNTAQRYLKFGKHKRFIIRSGHIRKFSLRSTKYPGNKLITQDVEGNSLFLGVKGWTKYCFVKITSCPYTYSGGNPVTIDPAPTLQPCLVSFVLSRYTSWYRTGLNDPSVIYEKDFGTPNTGTGDIHTWTDTTPQVATVPA